MMPPRLARWAPAVLLASVPLASALVSSCNNYLFEQKCPEQVKEQSIEMPAAKPTPADILFVVDNSGSMADEQMNLARNFESFINQIAGPAGDYQIMVVTTDVIKEMGEWEGLQISTFAQSDPYNLLDLTGPTCKPANIEHGCARGPDAAKRIISSQRLSKDEQVSAFQANVAVGSCGTGQEEGLQGMLLALNKTNPGGCNEGFLRDGANLVVIIVSDEDESDILMPGQSDDALIEQFVTDLGRFKSFSKIRVAAVVASVDGVAQNCRIPNTGMCGGLCQHKPAEGSHAQCTVTNMSMPCPSGEFCASVAMGNPIGQCQNEQLRFWSDQGEAAACGWCSYYNAPDCCSAIGGHRYVDFARKIEARVNQADSSIPISNCRGMPGTPIACLVDSICQEEFSGTLQRIARELVLRSEYDLMPPPVYPEGVVVKVTGGRFGDGKQLVFGTDFSINQVSPELAKLKIMGPNTPVEGENVEIYYVVDKKSDAPAVGACGAQ